MSSAPEFPGIPDNAIFERVGGFRGTQDFDVDGFFLGLVLWVQIL